MPKGKKETSTKKAKFSPHDRDLPATSSMLEEVRNELKADFRALDHKIDAKFLELKSEFFGIKSEFSGMKSEFSDVKSQIQQVLSAAHRTQALMEEQRRDNKIVMDGHREVNERMDRIEADVKEVRHVVADLARKRKTDLSQ